MHCLLCPATTTHLIHFVTRNQKSIKQFTKWFFYFIISSQLLAFKDTHREKSPSNKIPELTKSMNMDIWVVGTLK